MHKETVLCLNALGQSWVKQKVNEWVTDFLRASVSFLNCRTSRELLYESLMQHFPDLFEFGVHLSWNTSNVPGTFRAILLYTPSKK